MRRFKPRRCMRQRIWQAMRILRRFTIPDLCRVVDGATVANCQSYISRLYKEGYLAKFGQVKRGYLGEYQAYQLIKDVGSKMPVFLKGRIQKKEEGKDREQVETRQGFMISGKLPEEVYHDAT